MRLRLPRVRRPRTSRLRRTLLTALVVAVALTTIVVRFAGEALVVTHSLASADAIISLGSHEWERLPVTGRLAAVHPDAIVLLTEPREVTRFNCYDCAHRVATLRDLGVAEQRIHVLPLAYASTVGEAGAALAFALENRLRRLLVVTSPYHTRRALATFRKVFDPTGIEVGIEPARESSPAHPSLWLWKPYDRAYVAYEWAAIVYYAWTYDVPPR